VVIAGMGLAVCGLGRTTAAGLGVKVVVTPASAALAYKSTQSYQAAASGVVKKGVTWKVEPAIGGGTVDGNGLYTAPTAQGTYTIVATSVADPTKSGRAHAVVSPPGSIDPSAFLPADRATAWNPGLMGVGGIPVRSTICSTLTPRGGAQDDTAQIQRAINTCPAGQVVQLAAGTFIINSGNFLLINKGITLRGTRPGRTTLAKTNGAKPFQEAVSAKPSPLIIVGPSLYSPTSDASGVVRSTDLTADAVKGAYEVTVASAAGFSPGQIVLLDEASGAGWQTDPQGRGQIWASSDSRVIWQKHNPIVLYVDDFAADAFPTTPGTAGSWFSRLDRPTAEVKQIASVSGSTITFTTPAHISYRSSHAAQLSRYGRPHVKNAGVEDLKLIGGDAGNLRFHWAALSWAKNVENTMWHGEGFAIDSSFRIELREFYVHDAAWAQPGGGGYAISLSAGTAEVLIENGISVRANKVMVARSAGAGSVVGYNYMDMGYINTIPGWIEAGLNASHMVGSHHVLFEGNYGHNADSDQTHGNAIYHTFFRNHLRGIRASFDNQAGGTIDDATQSRNKPKHCAGLMAYSYWMSFVGNVLGASEQMAGWVYETTLVGGKPGIWMLGWDGVNPYPTDADVSATTLRHGNFDYVTNTVIWDPAITNHTLPNSLYLTQKPAFFDAGSGYTWPWVDPMGGTKLYVLPAKARYDAGTPFTQP
jgi:Pectate lyase superfamily protein